MKKKVRKNSAVALKYQAGSDSAPKVTARGKGKIAEKIIEIAKAHQVYIHEDPDLIEILSTLNINEEIPPGLYLVVAELLAFVYSLNKNFPDQSGK
jgi:flagellar biosynthesis protein